MLLKEFLEKIGRQESEILEISDEAAAIEAVKNDSYALQYVSESAMTEAVCLEAVKRNGYALQYVSESAMTEAVCLEAVKNNGDALQYVKKSCFK